ncbi:MAG: hypothetical protein JEZ02_04875 [Desulfatibacillum sp.]|nr:hypothetical protein [Desulfatibacillum sp.]
MIRKRNFRGTPIFILVVGIIVLKLGISLVLIVHPDAGIRLEPRNAMAQSSDQEALPPGEQLPEDGQDYFEPDSSQAASTAVAETPEEAKIAMNAAEMESNRLERERKELELLRTEVEGKIDELETMQKQIYSLLEQLEGDYDKREKHLIKILSEMPAKKSAPMIDKLEMDLVIKLFSRMKSDTVASILPFLDPAKAAEIGQKLASRE